MGWIFRKALNLGPFRISLSKSGVGCSVGVPGLRTGISSRKRRYTSVSVPGTGWRYQTTHQRSAKKKSTGIFDSLFGL